MLENHFLKISDTLRLAFYKRIFSVVREREGSLSAMEVFSLEVIYLLGKPTVSEFADFIGISRSAASYKVSMLIQKGYILKEASENDKREFRLVLTEKYLQYIKMYEESLKLFVKQGESKYSTEQLTEFEKNLSILESSYSEIEKLL
ncbi:MAG: MarR family transcriptional regulator [Clostridia bacterium]|nr:MarR family transcriptional regulator [Clostridia bacterium]